ncbi:unknown protein [Seminavis robusta]|uniref:Uncharacterized protein n=1 Tax=Seminavis robusta TaxID=568900 RepID=A0A9N8HHG0_9STRA|nr:unknown protein [Seminavis robusta]
MLLFIFMSLSGAGKGEGGYSPAGLLSIAWGMSKPTIRTGCLSALEDDFVSWVIGPEEDTVEPSKKRPVRPEFPTGQSTPIAFDDVEFSPASAFVGRDPKRRDVKDTPLVEEEGFASPESLLSPIARSPIVVEEDEFESPALTARQYDTRLDFNRVDTVDAATQTVDNALSDDGALQVTNTHDRLLAEIEAETISIASEEVLSRAVGVLFKKKRDALNFHDNEDDDEQDEDANNLSKVISVSLGASAEIISSLRQRRGSPIKILRIKETRQGPGDKQGRKLRRKVCLVDALITQLGLSPDETLSLLQSLRKRRGLRLLRESDCGLNTPQCAALMLYLPVTARGLERLQRFMKWALPAIEPSLFPFALRKSILGFELVSLEIGGSTRNERCLHVWIKQPAIAIQQLTQSALVSGKWEDSLMLSNHKDEIIVIQGSDRGGDITANLVRLANRSGGNSSQHCLPLAFYEFGKESYFNLKETIFNPHKPTRDFLQTLLNKEYHMIAVTTHNAAGAVVDAQCFMLRFVFPGSCRRPVLLIGYDDGTASINTTREERELPPTMPLLNAEEETLLQTQDHTQLMLQLIISSNDNQDIDEDDLEVVGYEGFVLRNCFGRVLCTEQFTEDIKAAESNTISFRCFQCRCFSLDDINSTLMGQGTASVMCPCTICVAPKKDFASYLTKPSNQQPDNREGDLANPELYEDFIEEAKGNADWVRGNLYGQAKTLKLKYHSVVHKPLLYTPPGLNTCSGMHVSSGLLTHCHTKMLEFLGELDRTTNWLQQMKTKVAEAKQFMDMTAKEAIERLRKEDAKLVRDMKTATSMNATRMVDQMQRERETLGAKLSAQTKARDAAKLFVEKGNDFLAGLSKKKKSGSSAVQHTASGKPSRLTDEFLSVWRIADLNSQTVMFSKMGSLRKEDAKLVRDMKTATSMNATRMVDQMQRERETLGAKLSAQTKARDAAKLFVEKGNDFLAGLLKKKKSGSSAVQHTASGKPSRLTDEFLSVWRIADLNSQTVMA